MASDKHRDLALRLLVLRTLALRAEGGLDPEAEQALVIQERVLWAGLTSEEQVEEQDYLAELWKTKPEKRWVKVPSKWGMPEVGAKVLIPNQAFGVAEHGHRPGTWDACLGDPIAVGCEKVVKWLQGKGFLVIDVTDADAEHGGILLRLPSHRVSQESDRFLVLLSKRWGHLRDQLRPQRVIGQEGGAPHPEDGGISVRATYDPIGGLATLRIRGLTDAKLVKPGLIS